MVNPIRAVFLDIDGTIVHEGRVVESAKQAIAQLLQTSTRVALCTGRSILHTTELQAQLGVEHGVYFNGGLALTQGQTVFSQPLPGSVVTSSLEYCRTQGLPVIVHTQSATLVFDRLPDDVIPIVQAYDFPPLELRDFDSWSRSAEPVYQINVFMDETWDGRMRARFPQCLVYRWHSHAVDLQNGGCDKRLGALALLREWAIPASEALHIGDGGNDVGMFQTMGVSIAMGNASDDVRRHAQRTTTRVDEDGVYLALKGLQLVE